jgi:hypothetical protein
MQASDVQSASVGYADGVLVRMILQQGYVMLEEGFI